MVALPPFADVGVAMSRRVVCDMCNRNKESGAIESYGWSRLTISVSNGWLGQVIGLSTSPPRAR